MSNAISSKAGGAPWNPFRHRVYVVIWTATVAANIGTWMYSAAAGWLMTELSIDPLMVSLVKVSTSLYIVPPSLGTHVDLQLASDGHEVCQYL